MRMGGGEERVEVGGHEREVDVDVVDECVSVYGV